MLEREVRILVRKEWRQLLRSRGALASAIVLPVLLLLIIPAAQMIGLTAAPVGSLNQLPSNVPLPPGLAGLNNDPRAVLRALLLPLFITLGGQIVPGVTANYTMLAERENRTIELLVALPVRIGQILLAKLLVLLILASGVTLTLFAINAVLIVVLEIGSIAYVAALLLLLICALAYATASALLVSLLARDFRTANNITGILVVPSIFISLGVMLFMPSPTFGVLVLAALNALAAVAVMLIALRVVTFERLLR